MDITLGLIMGNLLLAGLIWAANRMIERQNAKQRGREDINCHLTLKIDHPTASNYAQDWSLPTLSRPDSWSVLHAV